MNVPTPSLTDPRLSAAGTRGVAVSSVASVAWAIALAAFGVGDVVTTVVGIALLGATESAPLAAAVIDSFGLAALVVHKAGVFAVAAAVYLVAPRPSRIGIPLGLATLGVAVVAWNLSILATLA